MTNPPELERSRAAVTVACLEWLRCTGPAINTGPAHVASPIVAELLRIPITDDQRISDPEPPHPLWDRWIDG